MTLKGGAAASETLIGGYIWTIGGAAPPKSSLARENAGCCTSYQLWSTGSQLCMHPVCHSDGLFVSTGRGTLSAVPTHACTPVVLSLSLDIP